MTLVIEKGVPVADTLGRGKTSKYPFGDMGIGDSFALVDEAQVKGARNAAYLYKRKHKGWDYGATKYKDGSGRLWRVA